MIRVALKGLLGRKLRATLTAIAIVLGVAMMSGTYILTDTIDKAFATIFDDTYAGTDVVVSGKGADISFQGLEAEAPPIDESLLAEVDALPNVETAAGSVVDETNTKIIGSDGKAIDTQGAPASGSASRPARGRALQPAQPRRGAGPRATAEVVIDAGTADDEGFDVGDTIQSSTLQPKQDFELAGIAKYGDVDSLGDRDVRHLRPADRTAPLRQRGQGRRDLRGRRRRDDARRARRGDPADPARRTRRCTRPRPRSDEDKDDVNEFTQLHPVLPARVRRHRALRRRVRHLQHALDHRRAAHARVRDHADARRVAAADPLVGRRRGARDRRHRLDRRPVPGPRPRRRPEQLFKAVELDLPTAGSVFATRTVVVSLLVGT